MKTNKSRLLIEKQTLSLFMGFGYVFLMPSLSSSSSNQFYATYYPICSCRGKKIQKERDIYYPTHFCWYRYQYNYLNPYQYPCMHGNIHHPKAFSIDKRHPTPITEPVQKKKKVINQNKSKKKVRKEKHSKNLNRCDLKDCTSDSGDSHFLSKFVFIDKQPLALTKTYVLAPLLEFDDVIEWPIALDIARTEILFETVDSFLLELDQHSQRLLHRRK